MEDSLSLDASLDEDVINPFEGKGVMDYEDELLIHCMDALGLANKSKMHLVIKFELVDMHRNKGEDMNRSRLFSCETSRCLNFRHMFWDEKLKMPLPADTEVGGDQKYLLRVLLIRQGRSSTQEISTPDQIVALHEHDFDELVSTLVKGQRQEFVLALQAMSLDVESQVRLRLGVTRVGAISDKESAAQSLTGESNLGLGLGIAMPSAPGEFNPNGSDSDSLNRSPFIAAMPPMAPIASSHSIIEKFVQLFDDRFDVVPVKTFCEFLRMHVSPDATAAVAACLPNVKLSHLAPVSDTGAHRHGELFEEDAKDFVSHATLHGSVFVVAKTHAIKLVKSCLKRLKDHAEETQGSARSSTFNALPPSQSLPTVIAQLEKLAAKLGETIHEVTEQLGVQDSTLTVPRASKGTAKKSEQLKVPDEVSLASAGVVREITTSLREQLDSVLRALDSVIVASSLPPSLRLSSKRVLDGLVGTAASLRVKIRSATDIMFGRLLEVPVADHAQLSKQAQDTVSQSYSDLVTSCSELRRVERRARALRESIRVSDDSNDARQDPPLNAVVTPISAKDLFFLDGGGSIGSLGYDNGINNVREAAPQTTGCGKHGLGRQRPLSVSQGRKTQLIQAVRMRCPNLSATLVEKRFDTILGALAKPSSPEAKVFIMVQKDISFSILTRLVESLEAGSVHARSSARVVAGDLGSGVVSGVLVGLLEQVVGGDDGDIRLMTLSGVVSGIDAAIFGGGDIVGTLKISQQRWQLERSVLLLTAMIDSTCDAGDSAVVSKRILEAASAGMDIFAAAMVLFACFCVHVPCTASEFVELMSMLLDASNVAAPLAFTASSSFSEAHTPGAAMHHSLKADMNEFDLIRLIFDTSKDQNALEAMLDAEPDLETSRYTTGGLLRTLLHVAVQANQLELIEVLLRRGKIRDTSRDASGRTASQLCKSQRAMELFAGAARPSIHRVEANQLEPGKDKTQSGRTFDIAIEVEVEKPYHSHPVKATTIRYDAVGDTVRVFDEPGGPQWDVELAYGKVKIVGDSDGSELFNQLCERLASSERAFIAKKKADEELAKQMALLEAEEKARQDKIRMELEEAKRKSEIEAALAKKKEDEELKLREIEEKKIEAEEEQQRALRDDLEAKAAREAVHGDVMEVGEEVLCRFGRGRDFYPGKIASVHKDDNFDVKHPVYHYDVAYEDGDYEENVWRLRLRRPNETSQPFKLEAGVRVDAICSRCLEDEEGPVRRAVVVRNTGGAIYLVQFVEAELEGFEEALARDDMYSLFSARSEGGGEGGDKEGGTGDRAQGTKEGSDSVEESVQHNNGKKKAEAVPTSSKAPATKRLVTQVSAMPILTVGEQIECRYGVETDFFPGVVAEVENFLSNGEQRQLYHIQYDDGDVERVPRQKLRRSGERQERYLGLGQEVDAMCTPLGKVLPGIVTEGGEPSSSDKGGTDEGDSYVVSFPIRDMGMLDELKNIAPADADKVDPTTGTLVCALDRGDIFAPHMSKDIIDADKDTAMMEAIATVKQYIGQILPASARVLMRFGSKRHERGEAVATGEYFCWFSEELGTHLVLQHFSSNNVLALGEVDFESDDVAETLGNCLQQQYGVTIDAVFPQIAEPEDEARLLWHVARVLQGQALERQAASGIHDPQSSPRSPRDSQDPSSADTSIVDIYCALERAVRNISGPVAPTGETWREVYVLRVMDDSASGIYGSHILIEWENGTESRWSPPKTQGVLSVRTALQEIKLTSDRETDCMLRILLGEVLQVDLGSRMAHLQQSRAAPIRLTSNPDASLPLESPKARTVVGAFDLLDKLSARGMCLEIPAKVTGDTYCVKFSRGAGGELFMLGPTARPNDSPWLCLSSLRGMSGKELVSSSVTSKKILTL